ncbi:MAG: vitamin B12 dependent-methionine synthase activation domain-containing protein [Candidatus Hatepunaea meridiana]|nr:vitamin B12 dependent-methionine synthase activation domain-containing protein [Candidatus Hatepunaea meridiana]
MSRIIDLKLDDVLPNKVDVLKSQGMPEDRPVSETINSIYESAIQSFLKTAQARFIITDLLPEEFGDIFVGEGKNAPDAVPGNIYPEAETLAVYALTLGAEVSDDISRLFDVGDFPLAVMLDSVASNAAHNGSLFVERWYKESLNSEHSLDKTALTYSPGYCGWHISGQGKLFRFLQPERIGITLNKSYLMTPLKSISGVLVYGDKGIHIFKINHSYCKDCKSKSCLDRMRNLKNNKVADNKGRRSPKIIQEHRR